MGGSGLTVAVEGWQWIDSGSGLTVDYNNNNIIIKKKVSDAIIKIFIIYKNNPNLFKKIPIFI
jgi:hypothetical protein